MAITDPFTNFFKKRRQDAEENIRKIGEFRQKHIIEPITEIGKRSFNDLFKAKKEEKSRQEKIEDARRKTKEFEERYLISKTPSATVQGIQNIGERVIQTAEYPFRETARRGRVVAGQMEAGIPSPSKAGFFEAPLLAQQKIGAGLYRAVTSIPEKVSEMFFDNPEYRAEIRRIERSGTPEERRLLAKAKLDQLSMAAAFMTSVPTTAKVPMNPKIAGKILNVSEKATPIEVNAAWKNMAKKEYPRTVEEMSKRYKVASARIITEARDFLVKNYKAVEAKVIKKPQEQLVIEGGKTAPAEMQRTYERMATEKIKPATGRELEGTPIGREIELERHGGGLFAPKPKGEGGAEKAPNDLELMAKVLKDQKVSKEKYLEMIKSDLNNGTATQKREAKQTINELKESGFTPETFYDKYVSQPKGVGGLKPSIPEISPEADILRSELEMINAGNYKRNTMALARKNVIEARLKELSQPPEVGGVGEGRVIATPLTDQAKRATKISELPTDVGGFLKEQEKLGEAVKMPGKGYVVKPKKFETEQKEWLASLEKQPQPAGESEAKLDEVRGEIYSGNEEKAKRIYNSIKTTKPEYQALVDEVSGIQQQELDEIRGEMGMEELVRAGTEATPELTNKFKGFLRIAGEKKSRETGELFREHIPKNIFGVATDEVADSLGMSETDYMAGLLKDIEIGTAPTPTARTLSPRTKRNKIASIRSARTKIAKIKSMADALKLNPEFFKIIDALDRQLFYEQKTVSIPSYKGIKPYYQAGGVNIEASEKTVARIQARYERTEKKNTEKLVKEEIKLIKNMGKNSGVRSVLGKSNAEQTRLVSKMVGEATKNGIDVAIAEVYNPTLSNSVRALVGHSIRGYLETQGEAGKEISNRLLLARRKGDSYAGAGIAKLDYALTQLSKDEGGRFAYLIENGLDGDTPNLKIAVDLWRAESDRVFKFGRSIGLDLQYRKNFFPHFIPEEIIKNSNKRMLAFQEMVRTGKAATITEAKMKYHQYLLRKVARRYGHLEKPRTEDFSIYEKDPTKVLPSYLDSAWHRIADAEFLGANDEKVYELLDQISLDGGDAQTAGNMLDIVLGKRVTEGTWKPILEASGTWQVTTKFTPMTTLANMSQRLETLAFTNPKVWVKNMFRRMGREEKEWAMKAGVSFDNARQQFIQESGGITNIGRKYLQLIGFSPVENMNRIFTANVARDFIQDTFKAYLKTNRDIFKKRLERFGVNVEAAKLNKSLSEQDVVNASQYLNDITQYPYKTEELPLIFNTHPIFKILLRWKSFAFFSAKYKGQLIKTIVGEARRGNFTGVISALLAYGIGYQFIGEIVNDIWAWIRGEKRDKKGLARLVDNWMWIGSWVTDLFRSASYGKTGIYSFFTGADIADLVDLIDSASSLFRDRKTKKDLEELKARIKPLTTFAARRVPVIGALVKKGVSKLLEEKPSGAAILKKYGLGKKSKSGDEILKMYGIK